MDCVVEKLWNSQNGHKFFARNSLLFITQKILQISFVFDKATASLLQSTF